jgi:Ca2+-binding RTX toxin-like protein
VFLETCPGETLRKIGHLAYALLVILQTHLPARPPRLEPTRTVSPTLAGNPSGHNQTQEGGGDDVIDGGNGNNTALNGDACDDIIRGGKDTDTIEGGSGKDKIYGKGGPDVLDASDGARGDLVNGGAGKDTFSSDPGNRVKGCP